MSFILINESLTWFAFYLNAKIRPTATDQWIITSVSDREPWQVAYVAIKLCFANWLLRKVDDKTMMQRILVDSILLVFISSLCFWCAGNAESIHFKVFCFVCCFACFVFLHCLLRCNVLKAASAVIFALPGFLYFLTNLRHTFLFLFRVCIRHILQNSCLTLDDFSRFL